MPKKSSDNGLNKTLAFRVPDDTYRDIEAIKKHERRIESDVCRLLLIRGIAAYKRDRHLFEPENDSPSIKLASGRGKR